MQLPGTGNQFTLADIQSLEQSQSELNAAILPVHLAQNILSAKWDSGIRQYEQGDYPSAVQTLTSIERDNLSFQAPKTFAQLAMAKIPNGTNGTPTPPPGNAQGSSFLGIPMWWVLIVGLIAAVMVLVLLFVLVSLVFRRRRLERNREEFERYRAEEVEARRIAQMEARRIAESEKPQPALNIPCPNCSQPVQTGATFCPNCRYVLSPGGQDARPKVQTLPVSGPHAPGKVLTPPNRNEPQPAQVKQDDQAIKATLQRLWDRAEN